MKGTHWIAAMASAAILGGGLWMFVHAPSSLGENAASSSVDAPAHVAAASGSSIDAGRYLVQISGCNDCHTPGWDRAPGKVPESDWLTGVPVGWQGPWGTTYAANLRLFVQTLTEDAWVKLGHTRVALPPMPWTSLNDMSDQDLRSIYRFIKSLGPKGEPTPADLPPGQTPKTPYLVMTPKMPSSAN